MKIIKFVQILLFASLCSCGSRDEEPKFPSETQKGAGTFGCYVDNERLVPFTTFAFDMPYISLEADYYSVIGKLNITVRDSRPKHKNIKNQMDILIHNPKDQSPCLFDMFYRVEVPYHVDESTYWDWYLYINIGHSDIGKMYLTRFDTINGIVSGTFSDIILYKRFLPVGMLHTDYTLYNDTLLITRGRFDVKFKRH